MSLRKSLQMSNLPSGCFRWGPVQGQLLGSKHDVICNVTFNGAFMNQFFIRIKVSFFCDCVRADISSSRLLIPALPGAVSNCILDALRVTCIKFYILQILFINPDPGDISQHSTPRVKWKKCQEGRHVQGCKKPYLSHIESRRISYQLF
jgi:hypothetical protein